MIKLYLILGKICFGSLCFISLLFILLMLFVLWERYFQFVWFQIKHLFPKWQFSEEWYTEALMREDIVLKRFKRLVILKFKNYNENVPFGTKIRYIFIQK